MKWKHGGACARGPGLSCRVSAGVKLRAHRTHLQREFLSGWRWKQGADHFSCSGVRRSLSFHLERAVVWSPRPCALFLPPPPSSLSPAAEAVPARGEMPEMGNSLRAAALLAFVVLSILVSLLVSSVQQYGARGAHLPNGTVSAADEEQLRGALIYQLQQRRREILPLLLPGDEPSEGTRLPPQLDSSVDYNLWNEITHGSRRAHMDEMGCDSLVDMQAVEVLGSGYTKLVVKVNLAGGQPVALKLVNEQGIDMGKCVEDFKDPQGCRELVSYKLQKEIVLLQRLQHPNVIKVKCDLLFFFCASVQTLN